MTLTIYLTVLVWRLFDHPDKKNQLKECPQENIFACLSRKYGMWKYGMYLTVLVWNLFDHPDRESTKECSQEKYFCLPIKKLWDVLQKKTGLFSRVKHLEILKENLIHWCRKLFGCFQRMYFKFKQNYYNQSNIQLHLPSKSFQTTIKPPKIIEYFTNWNDRHSAETCEMNLKIQSHFAA